MSLQLDHKTLLSFTPARSQPPQNLTAPYFLNPLHMPLQPQDLPRIVLSAGNAFPFLVEHPVGFIPGPISLGKQTEIPLSSGAEQDSSQVDDLLYSKSEKVTGAAWGKTGVSQKGCSAVHALEEGKYQPEYKCDRDYFSTC